MIRNSIYILAVLCFANLATGLPPLVIRAADLAAETMARNPGEEIFIARFTDPKRNRCSCPPTYEPECGENGKTYHNNCTRECAGVGLTNKGLCEWVANKCHCSDEYKPECGVDRITYPNKCLRECEKVGLLHTGKCTCEEQCTDTGEKECGKNGVTYESACHRECANIELDYKGRCSTGDQIKDCELQCDVTPDPHGYNPCGMDGTVYLNKCYLECHGVDEDESYEACEKSSESPSYETTSEEGNGGDSDYDNY